MNSASTQTKQKFFWSAVFLALVVLGSTLIWGRFGEQNPRVTARLGHPERSEGSRDPSATSWPQDDAKGFGPAPEFSLTERNGKNFSSADLKGKVWITNFIFTSCASQCPLMSSHMKMFQALFPKATGLELVSFTVDPARDKPLVLSEYADRYGAEKDRWFFLTGPQTEINRVLKGFLLSGVDEPAMHSSRFILVDRAGQIRGYYDSADSAAMNQLVRDAKLLSEVGQV